MFEKAISLTKACVYVIGFDKILVMSRYDIDVSLCETMKF